MPSDWDHSRIATTLHKEVTVLLSLGNMDAAIEKLKEAKSHLIKTYTHYSLETWYRLPNVLQKAGRFDEAMLEIDFLLSDIRREVRKMPEPTPGTTTVGPSELEYERLEKSHRESIWRHRRHLQVREIKRLRRLMKKQKKVENSKSLHSGD